MKIFYSFFLSLLILTACQSTTDDISAGVKAVTDGIFSTNAHSTLVTRADVAAAFKEALNIGTGETVSQLSKTGAFLNDPKIHIPLPQTLASLQGHLGKVGLSGPLDELETRMNDAAVQAVPYAKDLFINAISQMTFDDIMAIYNGPEDSGTQYFKKTMGPQLANLFRPSVEKTIEQTGVLQAYSRATQGYANLLPDPKAELSGYVTQEAIDGLFYYIAQEERAIRKDPMKQTSLLLKKVFGRDNRTY